MARIEIFVPKYPAEPCAELTKKCIKMFGGLTSFVTLGHWVNPSTGDTVSEEGYMLLAYAALESRGIAALPEALRKYKKDAEQHLVMYSIDGIAEFI